MIESKAYYPSKPKLFILYSFLCLLVIFLALTGNWRLGLSLFFILLILVSSFQNHRNILILSSICIIFFLETNLDLNLGTVRGVSFMNLALIMGVLFFVLDNLKNEKRLLLRSPLNWAIILLVIYQFGSLLVTYQAGGYSEEFTELIILFKNKINPFIIFFIAVNLPESKREIRVLIKFLLGFFLFTVVMNVSAYYGVVRFISLLTDIPHEMVSGIYPTIYRLTGTIMGPNKSACFMVLFLPLLMAAIFFKNRVGLKAGLLTGLFFSLFVLVLTGSRAGLIGLIVASLFLLISMKKMKIVSSRQLTSVVMITLLLIILILVFYRGLVFSNLIGRFTYGQEFDLDLFTNHRYQMWKTGIEQILQSPLLGYGWNNFFPVHNNFLYHLGSLGIIGFGLYMFIYLRTFLLCLHCLEPGVSNFKNFLNMSFLSGFVGVLTIMLSLELHAVNIPLFLYIGLVIKYNLLSEHENEKNNTD